MSLPQLVHDARGPIATPRDRLIRIGEVLRLTGVGKSTWYALVAEGRAPRGVRITARCTGYSEQAVLSWVQARLHEASNSGPLAAHSGMPQ
jgi:prophage regulatory protein